MSKKTLSKLTHFLDYLNINKLKYYAYNLLNDLEEIKVFRINALFSKIIINFAFKYKNYNYYPKTKI